MPLSPARLAITSTLLIVVLVGCATSSPNADRTAPTGDEPTTTEPQPELTTSDAVPFEAITSAGTCIFTPEELSTAYAASEYVAGPGVPDSSTSQAACEYAHADPALQYVATPFTIWVQAYSYLDPDFAFRAGYENVPAPIGLNRAAITDYYCPPGGGRPVGVTWSITCEQSAVASIIAFDSYSARVVRDDIVWDVIASGAITPIEPGALESLLQIARLAAVRTL